MGKIKARRTNREELPGVAVLRDAVAGDTPAYASGNKVLDLEIEVAPDLSHLMAHDPDGFYTALERDETLGFVAAHVRSRQLILSELWVLPQHQGKGAGEVLMARALAYGERSGAREYMALVPPLGNVQSLLLRHGFHVLTPVHVFSMSTEKAEELGGSLAGLLHGREVTEELLSQRGRADLDRIDRLARNITREVDHVYWLKTRQCSAAFVRQGDRIAAYSYGGPDQVGPVVGTTQNAALSGLGWALRSAGRATRSRKVELRVPATFVPALDVLFEAGARIEATLLLYAKGITATFDRTVLGSTSLP